MSLRFTISWQGCKPLEWDAAGIRHTLLDRGLHEATSADLADLVIVMGCTFTKLHEDAFLQSIEAQRGKSPRHLVVSGCYLKQESGNGIRYARKDDIPGLLDELLGPSGRTRGRTTPQGSAPLPFVAVSDGCYGNCTFCSIRFVRGRHRSRPEAEVIADVRAALKVHGCVKLVGQEVAAYGRDIGSSLPALLRAIFACMPDVTLELGTLGPAWMKSMKSSDLAVFADPRIRGNIHLPLQSASDPVLKRMRRAYTFAQFARLLARLRSLGVTRFSTDLIAGFPGETLQDHRRSLEFLKSESFAFAQIFCYDPRPGTPAASFRQLPRRVRIRRTLELIGVFLAHSPPFCADANPDMNDFVNTNIEIENEEVRRHES